MRQNSCAARTENPKLASDMTAHFGAATDGLTIGRGALRQLHESLLRDAADHAVNILQEAGFAAGAGVYQAFRTWLPGETGVAEPQDLEAARLNDVLGRLSGETVAVMEVECRSRHDPRCRFLSGAPDTLNVVYDQMTQGRSYVEALGGGT